MMFEGQPAKSPRSHDFELLLCHAARDEQELHPDEPGPST